MKKTDPYRRRLIVLLSFLAAVLVFFGMVMFHYQIVNGDSYRARYHTYHITPERL